MSEPLFDLDKCPVASLPLVDFPPIDCEILPAPAPIFDCPRIEIPIEFEPPCPTVGATGTLNVANNGCGTNELNVVVTRNAADGSCGFDFDFDFQLTIPPAPCPSVGASAYAEKVVGPVRADVTVTRQVTPGSCSGQGQCNYLFDFDFEIPAPICPSLGASAHAEKVIGPVNAEVTVTKTRDLGSNCAYLFDFDFEIPAPICPSLGASAHAEKVVGPVNAEVTVTKTRDLGSNCAYLFDFDFEIPAPICPSLGASAHATAAAGEPAATVTVTKTRDLGSNCAYLFDFDFEIPTPTCPSIGGSAATTVIVGAPHVNLTVTQTGSHPSNCAYFFDFDFEIPNPLCPSLHASATTNTANTLAQPDAAVTVTKFGPASACQYLFDFDFTLPTAICPSVGGSAHASHTNGDPDVNLTVTKDGAGSECQYFFDFDFTLPDARCPSIGAEATAFTTEGVPDVNVTATQTGFGSACAYRFDFDFALPAAVCPGLTVTATGTLDDSVENDEVEIDVTTTKDLAEPCSFDLDFEFRFPPRDEDCVRFELTGNLNLGGFAPAVTLVWDGINYVAGEAITVRDFTSAPGKYRGVSGYQGTACYHADRGEYDITSLEEKAQFIYFTLETNLLLGEAAATVNVYWRGKDPGSPVTVVDRRGMFLGTLIGDKGIATFNERENQYEIMHIMSARCRRGQTYTALAKDGSCTVKLKEGDVQITAYDHLLKTGGTVPANKDVIVEFINEDAKWYVIAAEC